MKTVSYTHLDVYKRQALAVCEYALDTKEDEKLTEDFFELISRAAGQGYPYAMFRSGLYMEKGVLGEAKPEEVSLAIGKGGLNIKLASMLTEYTIDVFRELDESVADEDIYLDEFRDEIDGWVIDAIKAIGIDTAKAVLNAPREMLIEKTDLEEETVDEVIRILKSEFEEEGENSVEN